eukprot:Gb_15201 [translate_table: standard]
MVISDIWDIWKLSNTDRAQELKKGPMLVELCELIVSMICLIDTNTPCLGEVCDGMDSMLEKIREVMSETFYYEIKDIVVKRWNKMTTLLYTIAYALNPRFYHEDILIILGNKAPNKAKEVSKGYKKAFKLYPDAKVSCDVKIEFSEYAFSQNSYGDIDAL